jgi:Type I restriction-modification system methyltransferase subunit
MRKLYEIAEKKNQNFFGELLEPLFYDALNVNRGEQGYCPALHCRIPFLSGGLFEPIDGYDWEHNNFNIPNEVFSNAATKGREADGILDIFDRYNFTMSEDEPMEREVAIDPEMLGKVFENLLEVNDRKSKGAFYTPREIVHYMCQESLINYLTNTLQIEEEAIREFMLYGDFMKDEDTVKEKRQGNGGMYISESLFKLDADGKVVVDRLKDVDEALKNVRVADPAVGSGAFPLGMLNEIVRARQNISAYMAITMNAYDTRLMYQMERSPHNLKYETIKNCIFAADIEPSAVDIAQLRLWLSLGIDDEINPNEQSTLDGHKNPLPLPNLESNILCGNSLIDEFEGPSLIKESELFGDSTYQLDMNHSRFESIVSALIDKQNELFHCEDTEKKKQLKDEIESLRDMVIMSQLEGCGSNKIQRYNESKRTASKPYVLWQLDFARVFREKGGFDIVIGNPPYVQLSKEKDVPEDYKQYLKRRYGTSGGRLNLFIFMIHKSVELLKKNGNLTFIIPNTILTQDYYKDTRKMILDNNKLNIIVDYQDMPFEHAVVENVTLVFSKTMPKDDDTVKVMKGTTEAIQLFKNIPIANFKKNDKYAFSINSNDFIEKLFEETVPLSTLCNVNQAIALKGDKSLSCKNKYQNGYYKLLDGRNINKYGINWTGVYLDYALERIHSCKRKDIFECNEKLFFRRVSSNLIFTYDDSQYYALNTLVVVTKKETCECDLKYLLAIMNSKLMNYIYANKYKSTKKVFSEIQARSVGELPIKVANVPELNLLADQAIKIKKEDFSADIEEIINKIDRLVYKLYNLSDEEIDIIEHNSIE